MSEEKRMNRARIEWKPLFSPAEYSLIDQLLYRSNLTEANDGDGFMFHVRQLAKETGLSLGFVSQKCKEWSFLSRAGHTKGMIIKMDYPDFLKWIVHRMNNDCSSGEPISKKEEVRSNTINNNTGIVHSVNNKYPKVPSNDLPSEARLKPCGEQSQAEHPQTQTPIVHPVNNTYCSPSEQKSVVSLGGNPFEDLENIFEPNPLYQDMGKASPPKQKKKRATSTAGTLPNDLKGFNPDN